MQLLINHGLADYRWLHIKAVDDDCCLGRCCCGWFFWPCQGADSRGGHKEVPNWRDDSASCNNMPILTPSRGHPASLQTIDELHTMLGILTDDASGGDIPEARQPLTRALSLSRGIASMCPGAPPLVAEYLESVYTWEDHQSSSSSRNNTNSPPPPEAPPLILPPHSLVLHQIIHLKTYDEMSWHYCHSRCRLSRWHC